MIKRRFFTHSLFCPRGPGGPPEAVIILNDRPLLQKTLVHYCTTDPLKCKAHFKAEKKRKRSHIYFISPLFPIQHIDVRCRIYIDISIDKNSRFFIYFLLFITWGARMLGWWFGCVCVCVCGQKLGENTGKKMQKIPQSRPPGLPWSTQHLKTVSDLAGIVLKMMKLIFQISTWEANLELQCIAFQYFTEYIPP